MLGLVFLAARLGLAVDLPFVPVFEWGEQGYGGFREPSVLLLPGTSPQPTLVAFVEAGHIDLGAKTSTGFCCNIVSKRSTDGGRTWSSLTLILRNASQPSAVFSSISKKIVLNSIVTFTQDKNGDNIQTTSEDGITWSPPAVIQQYLGDHGHAAPLANGLELFTGPHKDRLLFIGWRSPAPPYPFADVMWFTDDSGKSYKPVKQVMPNMTEGQLVQNNQGTIIANMRHHQSNTKGRGIATSTDGGATWSAVSFDSALNTQDCESSIFRSPQNGEIYYSSPAHWQPPWGSRVGGSIRRSKTGLPESWASVRLNVTNSTTAFGYSALSDHPDKGKAGLLYETVLCPPGKSRDNCTCPGRPHMVGCVQKASCSGCTGGIVFSAFPLEF